MITSKTCNLSNSKYEPDLELSSGLDQPEGKVEQAYYQEFQTLSFDFDTRIDLGSISPMFYAPLLLKQIPEAQKDTAGLIVFLRFMDLGA